MREIVHVQAGQCGNQIGAKFWEVSCDQSCHSSAWIRFGPVDGACKKDWWFRSVSVSSIYPILHDMVFWSRIDEVLYISCIVGGLYHIAIFRSCWTKTHTSISSNSWCEKSNIWCCLIGHVCRAWHWWNWFVRRRQRSPIATNWGLFQWGPGRTVSSESIVLHNYIRKVFTLVYCGWSLSARLWCSWLTGMCRELSWRI